ncbi:cytochrome c oxidase subunit II [Devosia sp.]|uniref:cytochrome c oxidase subunit II n=1 Tax=Devosia sp. TaxID=1871048 RepID=UPI003A8EE947
MTGKLLRSISAVSAAAAALLPVVASAQEVGAPIPGAIGLQPSVTPIMDSIHAFHDGPLLWTSILIATLVLVLLIVVMVRFNAKANATPSKTSHNTLIEVIWTVAPVLVLVIIAIPSFAVLTDQLTIPDGERKYLGKNIFSFGDVDVPAPGLTVKAIGQQWYWDYEYVDEGQSFSSSMLKETSSDGIDRPTLKPDQPRLLAVDNEMVVPVDTTVRVEVTADPTGVIHSFAMPSFGIKVDAVPGKLNETWFYARKEGIYYGQCSELCGKDHAFMPIAIRVVSQAEYDMWMTTLQAGFVDDANATLPPL